jgi:cytoskeletal protein RodZ
VRALFFTKLDFALSTVDHDFGKRLAEARQARKLSVQEAARATRMRGSFIEALESGALSRFPNAAYAKSFLLMYAKFLGVDVSDVAKSIDTTTQVGVTDFQYLNSRAEDDREFQKAAADSRYDFVVARRESRSWFPLIAAGGVAALAGGILMVWMNISRVADDSAAFKRPAAPTPAPATAVQPVEPHAAVASVPSEPAAATAANPAPQAEPAAPRPNVVAIPPGTAPAAVPVEPESNVPRARPISPVASIAANDGALLADIPVPTRPATATAPPPSVVSVNKDDADVVLLEPRRKTWVVIRSGPGGQPLFEDYLYPNTRPMRLPVGKYYIELKEADAVAIVRNGKRISYVAPGLLVQ